MGLIFFRDDQLRVRNTRKKEFKPNDSWRRLLNAMNSPQKNSGRPGDRRQGCYLNVRYSKVNSNYGKRLARAHLEYIIRHGVGKDGKDPELYGNITREQLLDIKQNEENNFRFILSPERLGNIDLKRFVESYMRYISTRTGYRLQWVAANHFNTPQPHTHIIIKGVDSNFKTVRFSRYQIRYVFRDIARNYLTYLLGARTIDKEIRLARARSSNYCYLDKKIAVTLGTETHLELDKIDKIFRSIDAVSVRERLAFLASIKLIERTEKGYDFPKGWIDILKQIGRSDDFIKAVKSIQFNHPSQTIRFNRNKHLSVCGLVSYIGKRDELSDNNFMIVEALDGRNYICHLSPFTRLKAGDVVAFDTQKFRIIKSVEVLEALIKGKAETPLKQAITRTVINRQKDRNR